MTLIGSDVQLPTPVGQCACGHDGDTHPGSEGCRECGCSYFEPYDPLARVVWA